MPHLPDSHHDHDLVLIAALAAGDAEGADLTHARELVASCTECARVRDDLITLAAQLRTLPAPRRTRDYRLTDDQAARLRPAGWRRLLGTFGSSGFRFATPLGSAMATLGLAGLLLANTGMALPSGGGAISAAAPSEPSTLSQEFAAPSAAASHRPQPQGEPEPSASAAASSAAGAAIAASPTYDRDQASPGDVGGGALAPVASPPVRAAGGDDASVGATPDDGSKAELSSGETPLVTGTDQRLVLLASLLIVAGLGLVGLRLTARRLV